MDVIYGLFISVGTPAKIAGIASMDFFPLAKQLSNTSPSPARESRKGVYVFPVPFNTPIYSLEKLSNMIITMLVRS